MVWGFLFNMKTWQTECNAQHFTKEKLYCDFCKKQTETIIEVKNPFHRIGFYCCFNLHTNFNEIFEDKEFIIVRMISDILFNKRKEIQEKERTKSTYKLRYKILQRDNFKCVLCGNTSQQSNLEIDHIVPISEGGKTISSNLRTLCFLCNRGKFNERENQGGVLSQGTMYPK